MTLKELLYSKIEEDMVILPQEERLVCMDLKQFAEQPIAGILYDLGALPEDCHDGFGGEINSITQVCADNGNAIPVKDYAEFQRCWEEAIWDGIE